MGTGGILLSTLPSQTHILGRSFKIYNDIKNFIMALLVGETKKRIFFCDQNFLYILFLTYDRVGIWTFSTQL